MVAPVQLPFAGLPATPAEPLQASQPAARIDAFENAMARHAAERNTVEVAQVDPAGVQPTGATPAANADERARAGLGLEGVDQVAPKSAGDVILQGVEKMRGVFDARETRINQLMSSPTIDARTMMAMQMEMTNFSVLVDVSSKLTGKTTQTLDTLMKGQ
jgi:type III secretion system YscI/HrpB-like protein